MPETTPSKKIRLRLLASLATILMVVGAAIVARKIQAPERFPSPAFSTNERGSPISVAAVPPAAPGNEANSTAGNPLETRAEGSGTGRKKRPKPDSFQKRAIASQLDAAKRGETGPVTVEPFAPPTFRKPRPAYEGQPDPAEEELKGFVKVGFDLLAGYNFELGQEWVDGTGDPEQASARARALIPPTVGELHQKKVAVRGFLLPLRMDEGLAIEFLLVKDQNLCCYGVLPKINEWINVTVSGKGVKPVLDQPLTVCGTLEVGDWRENGFLVSLYRLKAEKVFGP